MTISDIMETNLCLIICLGEMFASTAGGDFTPHVVTVCTGEVNSNILYIKNPMNRSEIQLFFNLNFILNDHA